MGEQILEIYDHYCGDRSLHEYFMSLRDILKKTELGQIWAIETGLYIEDNQS
jgi:hypothetical protein